ncbi:MAG TPA: glycosyltransferase family 4 protein [Rhodocyclaceae bacterium]|nr:glycosyltransferase family 4 protein [Rhodocyclaceae bacterium]
MKLALVRQQYTPFGGAERFVERALAALRAQGTDVTIIARNWHDEAGHGFLRCNPFFLGRTWRDAGFAHCVQRIIGSGRFDLVQSHERIPGCHVYRAGDGVHATWLELRAKARGGMTKLATALLPWHRYTQTAETALFRHPDLRAVICNSRMVRDDIADRFGVATEKLHVIYNGVDLDDFHPRLREVHRGEVRQMLGISDSSPVILFVGSGFERKGIPTLLHALARMKHRDALLLIVGRDRKEKDMRLLANKLGVADRVHFLGGRKDVRPFYGAADCFALPTIYDPMPNAALEALACGLPVVTSSTCGAAELLQPGENGFVCEAMDRERLAEHLDTLTGPGRPDPSVVRASVEHLGLDTMVRQLSRLYATLLGAATLAK